LEEKGENEKKRRKKERAKEDRKGTPKRKKKKSGEKQRMPKSTGYQRGTRSKFARAFRKHGMPNVSTYLKTFKLGDFVDVKANGAVHNGMPHKFYHGKTGRVWNVTPRAVGVVVNKKVGNRIIPKKIHVRIEHVRHSRCREDFLNRVKDNEAKKIAAKKAGVKANLKRVPGQPRGDAFCNPRKAEVCQIHVLRHVDVY
jgi:large subunit ribosomal protein L21e